MSKCVNKNETVLACKNCKAIVKDDWYPCYSEVSEVKPKADVKFIGRDSAYEGRYDYLKDCLVNDEIAQLENISARLKKDGHKYLVIDTTGGEFIWTVK